METKKVYEAINAVQRELASEGISKSRRNQQQGYSFRGIDDIYNVVSPLLAKHSLCILPRVLSRDCVERTTAKGSALFYVSCAVEFDFVSSADGSFHTVKTWGEAMDSADKATNKAMSAAYKYAIMQAFAIPTEGDNDADSTTHEVAGKQPTASILPPAMMANHLVAISESVTIDALAERFNAAVTEAKRVGDHSALNAFISAKDGRKQQLQKD